MSVFNGVINDKPGARLSAIGYTSWSPLVRIDCALNSARCISGVLRPAALPFIRVLRNPTFKQDNARAHVAGNVRTFLDTENVRLLPWPARSPDLSPIETPGQWLPSDGSSPYAGHYS
ncbi:transposable element Tcb1 transposase [Trichonephila clavipes]|nr:transposable element Tcb1 transposase [Trichonephila clavipes]